jgi:hypothetical protein
MVFVSIKPFAGRRLFALAATILCLYLASVFAAAALDRQTKQSHSVVSAAQPAGN